MLKVWCWLIPIWSWTSTSVEHTLISKHVRGIFTRQIQQPFKKVLTLNVCRASLLLCQRCLHCPKKLSSLFFSMVEKEEKVSITVVARGRKENFNVMKPFWADSYLKEIFIQLDAFSSEYTFSLEALKRTQQKTIRDSHTHADKKSSIQRGMMREKEKEKEKIISWPILVLKRK